MRYKFAPIREAIFDIRIDEFKYSEIEDFEKIHKKIIDAYPHKKKTIDYKATIEFKENENLKNETKTQFRGFIFSNENQKRKVQVRLDGFTFNMLNPYTEWEEFSTEALRLWQIISTELKPNKIERIALRYINRIEIPIPFGKFQDFITNIPPIPKCLPQQFESFFMQTQTPINEINAKVILTETIEQPKNDLLPFILDIDIFKPWSDITDSKKLKLEFDLLRNSKNKIFENCITDYTRKLFN